MPLFAPSLARQLERMCQQAGIRIDQRNGDKLHAVFGRDRLLTLMAGDDGLAYFITTSESRYPLRALPEAVPTVFLYRNARCHFATWRLKEKGGEVEFNLIYVLPIEGLRPDVLRVICTTMIEEAVATDTLLVEEGFFHG